MGFLRRSLRVRSLPVQRQTSGARTFSESFLPALTQIRGVLLLL